jgi:hypothetical protein
MRQWMKKVPDFPYNIVIDSSLSSCIDEVVECMSSNGHLEEIGLMVTHQSQATCEQVLAVLAQNPLQIIGVYFEWNNDQFTAKSTILALAKLLPQLVHLMEIELCVDGGPISEECLMLLGSGLEINRSVRKLSVLSWNTQAQIEHFLFRLGNNPILSTLKFGKSGMDSAAVASFNSPVSHAQRILGMLIFFVFVT